MARKHLLLWSALVAIASASASRADMITIGDNDGFGFGAASVPDNAPLLNINLPEDRRSAAEAASTDGSQQTDFYSAVFTPLPFSFTAKFNLPSAITAASLVIDMGGFQAATFGQIAVSFNGVAQPGLLNFNDGAFGTQVRSFSLSASTIAAINLGNQFNVGFNRSGSNDAIAFDFFRLEYTPEASVVPLPSAALAGLALFGGVFGAKQARRRARHQ